MTLSPIRKHASLAYKAEDDLLMAIMILEKTIDKYKVFEEQ